jgi:hypothetical protein
VVQGLILEGLVKVTVSLGAGEGNALFWELVRATLSFGRWMDGWIC